MRSFLAAAAAVVSIIVLAPAEAVPFSVTGGSFVVGSGYGTGTGQLDATFTSLVSSNSASQLNFDLGVGQSHSFQFGRVRLREECIQGGNYLVDLATGCGSIFGTSDETDNLGVTAYLNFSSPLLTSVASVAVTGAFVGRVDSNIFSFTDFYIDFSPVTVNFGGTGSFVVDIGDMYFRETGPLSDTATVTLTAAPVPEPAMLGLFGLGAIALGLARRRRA